MAHQVFVERIFTPEIEIKHPLINAITSLKKRNEFDYVFYKWWEAVWC